MLFMTPTKQKQPPVDPADLANKEYVDKVVASSSVGGIADVPGLSAKLDSLAAADAGKMPVAPNNGKAYEAKGGSWVEAAAGSIGGGGGLSSPDTANVTVELTTANGTWTAAKNCFVSAMVTNEYAASITLNGVEVSTVFSFQSAYSPAGDGHIVYGSIQKAFISFLPVLKGDTLKLTKGPYGIPDVNEKISVYGVRNG